MSQQLDSSAINQVKELVLSGYHLNDIHGLACPTALLPENTSVESLERFALSVSVSAVPWTRPALMISFAILSLMPRKKKKLVALSMPITCLLALSSTSVRWITQATLIT
jgi:uncharacterized membrane protein